jgi:hypothetical protein
MRWTAQTLVPCGSKMLIVKAQAKSSRTELERRIVADDPCWQERFFMREKAWSNKYFRRGLAIRIVGELAG